MFMYCTWVAGYLHDYVMYLYIASDIQIRLLKYEKTYLPYIESLYYTWFADSMVVFIFRLIWQYQNGNTDVPSSEFIMC